MDIIHLLPDTVANQIAAGEVVQRPASVIKELVENSIDAGADHIHIVVKDAGRTLIEVIDNGKGMSDTDARMAFEKHATSKITHAEDLFSLHTMGFRGEALASIAAVAQVELVTRHRDAEIGTRIAINGGRVESQEPVACPVGCNISVKNLFYNLPARRKFLKSEASEMNHIEKSFFCIALVYPHVTFELTHNDQRRYLLPATQLRQRVCNIFGNNLNSQLYDINVESTIVRIHGMVGKPETARKQNDKQYFFVNGRYMLHPYFRKAVVAAYEGMTAPGTVPSFFIYFDVDPASIDVNISPTKTEIKFANEQLIWPIVQSAVREALGRYSIGNTIDFDGEGAVQMPSYDDHTRQIKQPQIHTDPNYNPFRRSQKGGGLRDWQALYESFKKDTSTAGWASGHGIDSTLPPADDLGNPVPADDALMAQTARMPDSTDSLLLQSPDHNQAPQESDLIQVGGRYVLTPVSSGLMCIDQHRAHYRVLYDRMMAARGDTQAASQRLLYPQQIELALADATVLDSISTELAALGYDIAHIGSGSYMVSALPAAVSGQPAQQMVAGIVAAAREQGTTAGEVMAEALTRAQARSAALPRGKKLSREEMARLVNDLFACHDHVFTPDGKRIVSIMGESEIEKHMR